MAGAAAALAVLGGLGVHWWIEQEIAAQDSRNRFLQMETAKLDRQIAEIKELEKTKADLLSRMEVIQELQQSRPAVVHLFDEIVASVPDAVHLISIEQAGQSVVVKGRAESNARVSAFMRKIEAAGWIGSPVLNFIEDRSGGGLSNFELRFQQREPKSPQEDASA